MGAESRKVVILGDGAPWIWNLAEELFTDRVEILDWYHADENISRVARVVFGEGTDEAAQWRKSQLDRLYEDAVDEVIEGLRFLKKRHRSKDEEIDKLTGYLERNGHRMKYRTFRQSGYYIGNSYAPAVQQQHLDRVPLASSLAFSLASHQANRMKPYTPPRPALQSLRPPNQPLGGQPVLPGELRDTLPTTLP